MLSSGQQLNWRIKAGKAALKKDCLSEFKKLTASVTA